METLEIPPEDELTYYCPVCGGELYYYNTLEDDYYECELQHKFDFNMRRI